MKIDIGCVTPIEGHEAVTDLTTLESESVEFAHSRNYVIKLTDRMGEYKRIKFWNELCRVLKPKAQAQIIVPYWACAGGHISPLYQEELREGSLYILNKEWREANMPDVCDLYTCDFDVTWGYGLHPAITVRNAEYQQFALGNYINAATELIATVTKR